MARRGAVSGSCQPHLSSLAAAHTRRPATHGQCWFSFGNKHLPPHQSRRLPAERRGTERRLLLQCAARRTRRCAQAGLHAPPTRHGAPPGRSAGPAVERHGHRPTGPLAPPPGPPPHFSEFLSQAPLKAVCMPAPPSPPSPPQSGLSSESFHRKGGQAPRPGSAAPWRLAPSCTFLISLSLSPRISSTGLCTRAGVPPASVPNWASLKHEIPRRQT